MKVNNPSQHLCFCRALPKGVNGSQITPVWLASPLYMHLQSETSVPFRQDPSNPAKCLLLPLFGAAPLEERTGKQRKPIRDCLYFAGGRVWALDWLQGSRGLSSPCFVQRQILTRNAASSPKRFCRGADCSGTSCGSTILSCEHLIHAVRLFVPNICRKCTCTSLLTAYIQLRPHNQICNALAWTR